MLKKYKKLKDCNQIVEYNKSALYKHFMYLKLCSFLNTVHHNILKNNEV